MSEYTLMDIDIKENNTSEADITTADVRDIYPYNVIYHLTGEVPDPVDVNLRGYMEALDSLSEKEREVLILRYRKHMHIRDAAKDMGISHERACGLESRALRKLRYPAWQRAMKNPSYTDVIRPLENDDEPAFIVMESDYLVDIQYGELLNVLGNVSQIHSSDAGHSASRVISDMAAYVTDELALLKADPSQELAVHHEVLTQEMQAKRSILSLVCKRKYVDALDSIEKWLYRKNKHEYLTYDEAQFFCMLGIVMRDALKSGRIAIEKAAETGVESDDSHKGENHGAVNIDIEELLLSRRTFNILKRMQCNDTDDIASIGRKGFVESRGCGAKALSEIEKEMKALGYDW